MTNNDLTNCIAELNRETTIEEAEFYDFGTGITLYFSNTELFLNEMALLF